MTASQTADVRLIRSWKDKGNNDQFIILDFSGAMVETVDNLEKGQNICAVKLLLPSQSNTIVHQIDSLARPLAVDIIRNGNSIRSYSVSRRLSLSMTSMDEIQLGDILRFRLTGPVKSPWGYTEYTIRETDSNKSGMTHCDDHQSVPPHL